MNKIKGAQKEGTVREVALREGSSVEDVSTICGYPCQPAAAVAAYTPLFTLIPFPVVVSVVVVVGGKLALQAEMNWPKVEPVVAAGSLFWPCTQRL